MQPSGSQSGGPDTAPDPVRTAVAQAANTVRYRRRPAPVAGGSGEYEQG